MKRVIRGYGVVDYSPFEVSEALKSLHVSHSIEGGYIRHMTLTVDGLAAAQPAWPVVIDKLKAVPKVRTDRDPMIYLICDSRAALAHTNVMMLTPVGSLFQDLCEVLVTALRGTDVETDSWGLERFDPTIDDYVNAASRPSFLNYVQTAVYKINPYDLRKEVQALIILYLAGRVSHTKLKAKLRSSFKLESLLQLMTDAEALKLRDACEVVLRKKQSVEDVAKQTGVASFDLLYILNSARKLSA